VSETCRVIINQVKQKLHLVGYLPMQIIKSVCFEYNFNIIKYANLLFKFHISYAVCVCCHTRPAYLLYHLRLYVALFL